MIMSKLFYVFTIFSTFFLSSVTSRYDGLIEDGYVQDSVSLTADNENNVYKPGDIVTFTLSYVTSPPPDENNNIPNFDS